MPHAWQLTTREPNFENIKSGRDFSTKQLKPTESSAAQLAAFESVNSPCGRAGIRGGGAFHLAEHKRIPLAANEVNFPGISPAEITAQNLHAMSPNPRSSHKLTILPHIGGIGAGIRSPRATPSVQQVQTSGDGVA